MSILKIRNLCQNKCVLVFKFNLSYCYSSSFTPVLSLQFWCCIPQKSDNMSRKLSKLWNCRRLLNAASPVSMAQGSGKSQRRGQRLNKSIKYYCSQTAIQQSTQHHDDGSSPRTRFTVQRRHSDWLMMTCRLLAPCSPTIAAHLLHCVGTWPNRWHTFSTQSITCPPTSRLV